MTSASRGDKVSNALMISVFRDCNINLLSGRGDSPERNTSYRLESSPSLRGASMETCLPEIFMDCSTSAMDKSNSLAISSAEGGRSWACSKYEKVRLILLMEPILFSGKRTTLDCSAKA